MLEEYGHYQVRSDNEEGTLSGGGQGAGKRGGPDSSGRGSVVPGRGKGARPKRSSTSAKRAALTEG